MAKLALLLLAVMALITFVSAGNPSKVVCWGSDVGDDFGTPDEDFTSIDADASFDAVCGLHDSSVVCWGDDTFDHVTDAPTDDNFVSISVGGTHACALTDDGEVVCWGSAFTTNTAELGNFREIASGNDHSCAIYSDSNQGDNDANTVCWGRNVEGQLDVPAGSNFEDLALGYEFSCGRDNGNGQVTCWGATADLDDDFPTDYDADEIGAGVGVVCIIDNGNVTCWGDETEEPNAIADTATLGDNFNNVYVGNDYGCALTKDHDISCWGPSTADEITEVPTDTNFDELALGSNIVCGRLHANSSPASRPSSVFSALLN